MRVEFFMHGLRPRFYYEKQSWGDWVLQIGWVWIHWSGLPDSMTSNVDWD